MTRNTLAPPPLPTAQPGHKGQHFSPLSLASLPLRFEALTLSWRPAPSYPQPYIDNRRAFCKRVRYSSHTLDSLSPLVYTYSALDCERG